MIKNNGKKNVNNHYLSLSYKSLLNKNIIHFILFLIDISLVFLQIVENYYKDNISLIEDNSKYFNPLSYLSLKIDQLPTILKTILYPILIVLIVINYYLLNAYRFEINIFIMILINFSEILFYRILTLILFNYLFIFNGIYLFINIIFTIPYMLILIMHFYKNHLFLFFPNIINYPYDSFSMIIDLHFLFIKFFISLSRYSSNLEISKLSLTLSILLLFLLLIYLTYLMLNKSYYLMNNISLNKSRYALLLTICISVFFILTFGKKKLFNFYFIICLLNIFYISLILVGYFYNPYKYAKFEKDDNIENIFYYFFLLDRVKNKYFEIEQIIEEHISKCNMCNLCKKYKIIKGKKVKEKEDIDLYKVISNGHNTLCNLMNMVLRRIKKYGKNSFINNTYYLINLSYAYCLAIEQNDHNLLLNTELIYDIINSENKPFLEENKISLNRIKYTNDFFIKANIVIEDIYKIFEIEKVNKRIKSFFVLGEDLEQLNFNEIKANLSNNYLSSNANGIINDGLPNCNNLLTICSLFYEELFNETISNSGVSIKDNPNLFEDLINNNYKNSRQITLKLDILDFGVKIIRAGGHLNKYENKNFFDVFASIAKNNQIFEMKKTLLYLNDNSESKSMNKNKKPQKAFKGLDRKKQYIYFNFLIEEKENNAIYYRFLKLKLSLIYTNYISDNIYLNGSYILNHDILVCKEENNEETVLYFGNKKQIKNYMSKNNLKYKISDKIIIRKSKTDKYLGEEKLIKITNFTIESNNYNIYHLSISKKFSVYSLYEINSPQNKNFKNEEINYLERANINTLLFNDLASHASSAGGSMARNTLISYNRENKKVINRNNETKELKITKLILFITIFLFLICIIIISSFLTKSFNKLRKGNDLYLKFRYYTNIFHNLYFSTLSLGCIAKSTSSYECDNYLSNFSVVLEQNDYSNYINWIKIEDLLKSINSSFIDIRKFLFYQNHFLCEHLNDLFIELIKDIAKFNNKLLSVNFQENITHYAMNQDSTNGTITLNLFNERNSFSDLSLLMISRFSKLSDDIKNIKEPIYILNTSGQDIFKNIYKEYKLTTYQYNFYLIILDFKIYSSNIEKFVEIIRTIMYNSKSALELLIFCLLNFVLVYIIIIIIMVLLLVFIYFIIIFKTLNKIKIELNEKVKDITIKELMKKKIDNLKILLKFYDNDINKTVNNLNKIYDNYKEVYNLKLKEEIKLLKKEGKKDIEKNNNKFDFIKLIKTIFKSKIHKYSFRKKYYIYLFLFIITFTIIIYILNQHLWIIAIKTNNQTLNYQITNEKIFRATDLLLSNHLNCIYENLTLEEISRDFKPNNLISYVFGELTNLYKIGKTGKTKDFEGGIETIDNCTSFYNNLKNDIFIKIKAQFIGEEDKLLNTMMFFCEWSNIFLIKNYNNIYLQLFSLVEKGIYDINNTNYSDIILYINKKENIKIDIMYLTIYIYLIDIMISNIKKMNVLMLNETKYYIIITNIIEYPLIISLIFIVFFVYVRNIDTDCKKFIHIRKIFKVCNTI